MVIAQHHKTMPFTERPVRRKAFATTLFVTLISLAGTMKAQADTATMLVFDASGSMWNPMEGDATRIEIARDVIESYFNARNAEQPVAVLAYGHRRRGDCADIETVAELGEHTPRYLTEKIRNLNPQGMTPLTASMQMAFDLIPHTAESADIVLVTDGLENCGGDPCALAAEMAESGVNVRAHVVGFGMTEVEVGTLACVAEQTGGQMFHASSGEELASALGAVAELQEMPVREKLPEIEISGPEATPAGAEFIVEWTDVIRGQDIVTIVPAGAAEDAKGDWRRVRDMRSTVLVAPGAAGMYELRYVRASGGAVYAHTPIEVTGSSVQLEGPESVYAGSRFRLQWSHNIHNRDLITIVPEGAAVGETGHRKRVASRTDQTLTAPAEPGMYELRYILGEGMETAASKPIEVKMPEVVLSAPDTVPAGGQLRIDWSMVVHNRDFVTIVPIGAAAGTREIYRRVSSRSGYDFSAPEQAGLYEIRYVAQIGKGTLASLPLEVVEGEGGTGE